MRILKAYAQAGMLGQDSASTPAQASTSRSRANVHSRSGDVISISDEARDLMHNDLGYGYSVTPQDATYDQRGNIMRQVDSMQGELRALASQFATQGEDKILGSLKGMQQQLTSLRAMV